MYARHEQRRAPRQSSSGWCVASSGHTLMPTGRAPARLGSRARGADALDILEAVGGGGAIAEFRGEVKTLF